jgi:urea transporter
MQKIKRENTSTAINAILFSYSQIFFAKNKAFAIILIIVSFLDWWMGIAGLTAIITANITAYLMGFNRENIKNGIYGFNSLLVGLGIGIYFAASWNVFIIVIFASIMTLFVSFVLEGLLAKYGLPFLSLPFLFSIWLLYISFHQFNNFGLSLKDIYTANELYSIGGLKLVKANDWLNNLPYPAGLKTYFLSLGAIFFQFNIFGGILIALGLLIHSRQSFLMSLLGFYAAYIFYNFIGVGSENLSVTYYGFNFILSAIAIGSYFLVPSFSTLLWVLLSVPVLVFITVGTDNLFANFHISVYSLPFNTVVLGFIYALKLRTNPGKNLRATPFQMKNPEANAYYFRLENKKNNFRSILNFSLPFNGKWYCSQGFEGKYTHKDAWKYAWDFVIVDEQGKQYSKEGNFVEDYYCYNKPVTAVADGTVVEIADGIDDNSIGEINIKQNWGNSIVIHHGYGIYSQISHLKSGSIKVSKGMIVRQGQILANVGNSGRSPYPHLHFQFQSSYIIGSQTIKIPLSNYISQNKKIQFFNKAIPQEGETLENIIPQANIQKIFRFMPKDKLKLEIERNNKKQTTEIIADIDMFNNTYLKDTKSESYIYFKNEKAIFKNLNYIGNKKSALYYFFNSLYFIPLGYYEQIKFNTQIPVHLNHKKAIRLLQDFVVNFKIFLDTEYSIKYKKTDNKINPQNLELEATIKNKIFDKTISEQKAKIVLRTKGKSRIEFSNKNQKTTILWERK